MTGPLYALISYVESGAKNSTFLIIVFYEITHAYYLPHCLGLSVSYYNSVCLLFFEVRF